LAVAFDARFSLFGGSRIGGSFGFGFGFIGGCGIAGGEGCGAGGWREVEAGDMLALERRGRGDVRRHIDLASLVFVGHGCDIDVVLKKSAKTYKNLKTSTKLGPSVGGPARDAGCTAKVDPYSYSPCRRSLFGSL
jgi:hypothetical protein